MSCVDRIRDLLRELLTFLCRRVRLMPAAACRRPSAPASRTGPRSPDAGWLSLSPIPAAARSRRPQLIATERGSLQASVLLHCPRRPFHGSTSGERTHNRRGAALLAPIRAVSLEVSHD